MEHREPYETCFCQSCMKKDIRRTDLEIKGTLERIMVMLRRMNRKDQVPDDDTLTDMIRDQVIINRKL